MPFSISVGFLMTLLSMAEVLATAPQEFVDPAPPKVASVADVEALPLRAHPKVTYHAAPRALHAKAIIEGAPGFLGARREPRSLERPLRKNFGSDGLPLVWELETGSGYAAPAILGERMVLMHRVDDQEIIECVHPADGRLYWNYAYPTAYEDPFGFGDGPKCTPLLDGDLVWTLGVEGRLHCLHLPSGRVVWQRDLTKEFALGPCFFGVGSTPLLLGDQLIVNLGAPKGPTVAAFSKQDGRLLWGAGKNWGASYAAPTYTVVKGRQKLLVFAGGQSRPPHGGLISIDLATQKIEAELPWRSRTYYSVNAATPIVHEQRVLISEAYGRGAMQWQWNESGALEPTWSQPSFGIHWATPLRRGEFVYGCAGEKLPDSELVCLEWKTGKERWRKFIEWEEEPAATGGTRVLPCTIGRATLIEADQDVLCLGEWGHLLWLKMDSEGVRVLARTWPFFSRESWVPPVLSRGLLYLRQPTTDLKSGKAARFLCYDLRH